MIKNNLPYGYSLEASHEKVTECFGLDYPAEESEIVLEMSLSSAFAWLLMKSSIMESTKSNPWKL